MSEVLTIQVRHVKQDIWDTWRDQIVDLTTNAMAVPILTITFKLFINDAKEAVLNKPPEKVAVVHVVRMPVISTM